MQSQQLSSALSSAFKVISANSVDPDQTAPLGAVWSGSTLFVGMQKIALRSLQEYSADDINRRHFQMQFFLALYGLNYMYYKCNQFQFEIF